METQGGRRGRPPYPDILTPAEWHVLEHLRKGLTNAEIAVELGISPDGVKYHVSNMLAKLELPDRRALATWKPPRPGLRGRLSMKRALLGLGALGGVAAAGVAIIIGSGVLGSSSGSAESNLPNIHSTLDITSFQLTEKLVYNAYVPLPNGAPPAPLPPGGATSTIALYFRQPGDFRQEQVSTIAADNGSRTETSRSVSLWDSDDTWGWTPGSSDVVETNTSPTTTEESNFAYPPRGTSIRSVLATIAPRLATELAGEGVVAGRRAYIIDIDPGPCSTKAADLNGRRRIWLDKETLFLLKSEQYSATDGRVTVSTEVTSIKYNQPLAARLFELPPGVTVRSSVLVGSCSTAVASLRPAAPNAATPQARGITQACGSTAHWTGTDAGSSCPGPTATRRLNSGTR